MGPYWLLLLSFFFLCWQPFWAAATITKTTTNSCRIMPGDPHYTSQLLYSSPCLCVYISDRRYNELGGYLSWESLAGMIVQRVLNSLVYSLSIHSFCTHPIFVRDRVRQADCLVLRAGLYYTQIREPTNIRSLSTSPPRRALRSRFSEGSPRYKHVQFNGPLIILVW